HIRSLPFPYTTLFRSFYMGVNAGAFFGMMLCGYLAENFGWSWGFGLAGIFMMLGMLQFWLAKDLFGNIGAKPLKKREGALSAHEDRKSTRLNSSHVKS